MKEEIALVTGGSSGLGYAIAEELLKQNIPVCMIGRNKEKLMSASNVLKQKYKTDSFFLNGDIADEIFVKEVFNQLEEKNKKVKYLFNCAGVGRFGVAKENTKDKIEVAFRASLVGLILMSSYSLKSMREEGTIINIMSTAALKGNANESIYCAAKWGARGFTESLRAELKGSNIKVVGVYPGGMNTSFWNEECGSSPDVSKFMKVEEVAEEIVHAILDRQSMYVSELIIERK